MKQFYKVLAIVLLLATAAACDTPLPEVPSTSDKVVKISALPAGDFTKATDTAFEVGDALSVFGFKPEVLTVWLNNGKFTKGSDGFASDQDYFWYDGEESSLIMGVYPYSANYSGEQVLSDGVEFCVKSDQSTHAGYTDSDLMVALREATPTTESVVLEFNHTLSKVVIDIDNQTAKTIQEVYLDGVKGNLAYTVANEIVLSGGEGAIKAGELATASEGFTNTYVLIIPPQEVTPTIKIITTDGREYLRPAPNAIVFGSGKVRHLTTTITEQSISAEFDATVNDWSADENVEFKDQTEGGNEGGNEGSDEGGNEGGNEGGDDIPVVEGMTVNPLWSVELVPEFYDEETQTTYYNLIRVLSTDEENGFFVEFFAETYFNESIKPNISEYVSNRAAGLRENLKNYNAENGADFNMLDFRNYHFGLYDMMNILEPGRCVVAMWGMTVEGEVTGLYYISDVIEIKDPATPEYKAWLGTYKLVSADEEKNAVTSMITVTRNVTNESYWIEGWNGIANLVAAKFNPTGGEHGNGAMILYPQTILEDIYIGETHLAKIFFGSFAWLEGGYVVYETEDMLIGQAQWLFEDDTAWAGILPYTYSDAEGTTIKASEIGFFGVLDDGGYTMVTNEIHAFQEDSAISMIRQNTEEPAAVARKHNIFDEGNNGIAKSLDAVKREKQPQPDNYVVGGKKFSAINF